MKNVADFVFTLSVAASAAVCLLVGGCQHKVTIPAEEASLKEACHGRDRPMAGVSGFSVWRCGEGDQAKYAIYKQGSLVREANELEAAQTAAAFSCIGRGLKISTPEYEACAQTVGEVALTATNNLRNQENAETEMQRRRIAAALSEANAAYQATLPRTVNVQANCTSTRSPLGMTTTTTCY